MSKISICNQALGWLGANLITSFTDGTDESNLCQLNYDPLRDAVLEERDWTFATARDTLQRLVDPPAYGYAFQFQLPTDLIRLIGVWSPGREDYEQIMYEKEGSKILCDSETINIRYIKRVVDEAQYTALFTQALASRIAVDLAIPITNNRTLQADMMQLYQMKLRDASASDGMQARREEKFAGSIARSRY